MDELLEIFFADFLWLVDNSVNIPAVHTHHFEKLYRKKAKEVYTLRLLTDYDNQKKLEATIKKVEEEVEAASRTKHLNEAFKRWVQVPTDRHYTLCGARGCFSNCHAPCTLPKYLDKEVIKRCKSMRGGDFCTVCHHSYYVHYHDEDSNRNPKSNGTGLIS